MGGATSGNRPDFSLCLSGPVWFVVVNAFLLLKNKARRIKTKCRMELVTIDAQSSSDSLGSSMKHFFSIKNENALINDLPDGSDH